MNACPKCGGRIIFETSIYSIPVETISYSIKHTRYRCVECGECYLDADEDIVDMAYKQHAKIRNCARESNEIFSEEIK